MSDTTGSERERGDSGEFSDPTSPSYGSGEAAGTPPTPETPASQEGAREVTWSSDDTQAVPADGTRPIHTALLEAGIPIVEHLTGLDALVGRPFRFFALPPAIEGMGTFIVRAVALVG